MHALRSLAAASALAFIAAASGQTPTFTVVDLSDQLPPDYFNSYAADIAETNIVYGNSYDEHGLIRVIKWADGVAEVMDKSIFGNAAVYAGNSAGLTVGLYTGTANGWTLQNDTYVCVPLPDPCGSFNNIWRASSAEAINEAGHFTGTVGAQAGEPFDVPNQAYIGERDGDGAITITKLGTFNGESTRGFGINELGDVVGWSGVTPFYTPLLFRGGAVIELPTIGGAYNVASDINDAGTAVGHLWETPDNLYPYAGEGVLWDTNADPIAFQTIGKLDGFSLTSLTDINNNGAAVGRASNGDNWLSERAILWYEGELYNLNDLINQDEGWTILVAYAINDSGHIVGYGVKDGVVGRRAVLLSMGESVGCTGDMNGDGHVGQEDLGALLASYGVDAGGDMDGDGDTDQADLGIMLGLYGTDC